MLGLALLVQATDNLLLSAILARVVSAAVNFTVNRRLVFARDGQRAALWPALHRYAALALVVLTANVTLIEGRR